VRGEKVILSLRYGGYWPSQPTGYLQAFAYPPRLASNTGTIDLLDISASAEWYCRVLMNKEVKIRPMRRREAKVN